MSRHRTLRALVGLAMGLPLAALGHGLTGYAAPAATTLTAAQVAQLSQGANKSVIVVLRNQHADLYGRVHSTARASAIHADQAPVLSELVAVGAQKVTAYSLVNMIAAHVSSSEIAHLKSNPAVQAVVPNLNVPRPQITRLDQGTSSAAGTIKSQLTYPAASACTGTPNNPQLNPEALQVTNDAFDNPNTAQAVNLADGSGVLVATIADGLDPSQPDFQRLPSSPDYIKDGPQVITQYVDFTGNGLDSQTGGAEMFGDASSIAAQGNTAYDVEQSIAPGLRPYAHCYVKVVGMAPGANVMAIKANFTFADIVLAIQYAVQHGANVINESFGADFYPDIATNPIDLANDAATAQGVTVVVSSGDAGSQNTVGWPATDPNVIDVGATTTYRSYAQLGSPYHIPGWNLSWQSNQLSGLSTAGISYNGNSTIDVVAPGDLNWALCSDKQLAPNVPQFTECGGLNFQNFGGTSESSPLTAGEAALIIDAYGRTHNGAAPSPQIVKEIIKGTATNLDLPSYEQGAGLINALAAVKAAMAYNGPDGPGSPSQSCPGTASMGTQCSTLVYSTGNAQDALVGKGQPGTEQHFAFKVTNQGAKPVAVRPLVQMLGAASPAHYTLNFPTCGCVNLVRISSGGSGYDPNAPPTVTFAPPQGGGTAAQGTATVDNNGSVVGVTVTDPGSGYTLADNPVQVTFTDPNGSGASAAGQLDNAAGTPTVINSSGSTRVYEEQAFTVTPGTKHLSAAVSFPDNYNGDFIRIVLLDPSNAMAAYSVPQGPRAQWGISEVADPAPGTWHAFVILNRHVFVGPVALDVTQQKFVSAGTVSPVSSTLLPGKTASFQVDTHTPAQAGDQSEDVVLNGTMPNGKISTVIPVVLRSLVPLNPVSGGSFSGILTGGNGRGSFGGNNAAEQILNYEFNVPAGEQDVDLSLNVNDPGYVLGGILVSPNGDIDYQSNLLTGNTLQLFQRNPTPGAWHFVVFIDVFSSGNQTAEPFTGRITFNQAAQNISGNLPNTPNWSIQAGSSQQFQINITNPGSTPESLFADARLAGQQEAFPVAGFGGGSPFTFVFYPAVPAESTEFSVFSESFSSPSQPISTDIYDNNGPPIPAGGQGSPEVIGSNFVDPNTGNFASVATMTGQEVPPGEWQAEAIPTPPYASPATDAGIEQAATAMTQTFDPNAAVSTGNFWLAANQVQGAAPYTPLNLNPTQNGQITVTLSPPQGTTGQLVKGVIYVETMPVLGDPIQFNQLTGSPDELIAIPYEYTVS